MCAFMRVPVKVGGQLAGAVPFPLCGFWGWNLSSLGGRFPGGLSYLAGPWTQVLNMSEAM